MSSFWGTRIPQGLRPGSRIRGIDRRPSYAIHRGTASGKAGEDVGKTAGTDVGKTAGTGPGATGTFVDSLHLAAHNLLTVGDLQVGAMPQPCRLRRSVTGRAKNIGSGAHFSGGISVIAGCILFTGSERMHRQELHRWQHQHSFGTDVQTRGERRTWWVIAVTFTMMTVEIVAGTIFGSMALLADGWHMGTHAAALGVTVFAYIYARRHAKDPRYSFGTGKVGSLGGFASAVGLAVVALLVFGESVARLVSPVGIRFNEAIGVAVIGLIVNLGSAWLLHDEHHHHGASEHVHHDHNLRGAYLHVVADAMTSVLAIMALFTGKLLGWVWMDPMMGIVGAVVIARWSFGLLRDTSRVLLDGELAETRRDRIRKTLESGGDTRVADLHVWRVGPKHLASILSVVTHHPKDPDHYKDLLAEEEDLVHVTVEVHRCPGEECVAVAPLEKVRLCSTGS